MMWILKKENLFIRIAIGFAIGILLGLFAPQFSLDTKIVGDIYLAALKYMVIPVLFFQVMKGIINSSDVNSLGRVALKTVVLYMLMFLASFAVSFGVAYLIRPGKNLEFDTQPVYEGNGPADISIWAVFHNMIPHNITELFSPKGILPALILAIILSAIILKAGDKAALVRGFINRLSDIVLALLSIVMEASPIGVMSLVAVSLAEYGGSIFQAIGRYIICCWAACFAVFMIVFLLPVRLYTRLDNKTFLSACGKLALLTMSTASSAATLPTTIKVSIEELGAPEAISNFTLPLGCTINMCGGACSFCCLTVFVSDFYSIDIALAQLVAMAIVATLINMAAPGIPGGGIALMTSFLTIFSLPIDIIGPIAAVYRLLDMAFTTINVEGDIAANLIISKTEKLLDYQ